MVDASIQSKKTYKVKGLLSGRCRTGRRRGDWFPGIGLMDGDRFPSFTFEVERFRQGGVGSCAALRVVVQEPSAVYHAELYVQQVSRNRHEFELGEKLYIIRTAFKDSAVASTESRVDSVNSVIWARTRFVRWQMEGSRIMGTDRISSLL